MPKIQNFKFHYAFNKFGRDPPQEYTYIFGRKSGGSFQRTCRWKLLLPYDPMLTKQKKKCQQKSVWRYGGGQVIFPKNLTLIRLTDSGKMGFTDERLTPPRRE